MRAKEKVTITKAKLDNFVSLFEDIRTFTSKKFPYLSKVKLNWCEEAERSHARTFRFFAHTGHIPNTICIASEFLSIPKKYIRAVILHEMGHIICIKEGLYKDNPPPRHIKKWQERLANEIIEEEFGIKLVNDPEYHYLQKIAN